MKNMLFVAGCTWILFATTKWKMSNFIWGNRINKVFGCILGIYNMFLALFGKGTIGEVLLIIDYVLIIILDIYFFILRLRKGKNGFGKIYQSVIGFVFIIMSLLYLFDLKRIYVGIAILTGAMMMVTVPFQEAIEILNKEKE